MELFSETLAVQRGNILIGSLWVLIDSLGSLWVLVDSLWWNLYDIFGFPQLCHCVMKVLKQVMHWKSNYENQ